MVDKTNSQLQESLSAMIDGEHSELEMRRLLKLTEVDDELRQDWSNYQTIGSVLRGELRAGIQSDSVAEDSVSAETLAQQSFQPIDISSAVMSAIESDDTYSTAPVVENAPRKSRWKKTFGQFAVAASVAGFAVIGVQQFQLANVEKQHINNGVASHATEPASIVVENNQPPLGFETLVGTSNVSATNVPQFVAPSSQSVPLQIQMNEDDVEAHFEQIFNEYSSDEAKSQHSVVPYVRSVTIPTE